jgi:activating signal cointegrator 1
VKAITLTQPWATLVAIGAKSFETRSWRTSYTGPLAIHAARTIPNEARKFARSEPALRELNAWGYLLGGNWASLPKGAIVAVCRLDLCEPAFDAICKGLIGGANHERVFGDFSDGRYAWRLDDVVWIRNPIPCRGALGLWTVPDDLHSRILSVLS